MAEVKIGVTITRTGSGELKATVQDLDQVGAAAKKTQSSLDNARASTANFASAITGIWQGVGQRMVDALAGAAAQLLRVVELGGRLADMSAKLAAPVETLQKWEFAGKMVGVSLEQIGWAYGKLQVNLASGGKSFYESLERIGLSAEDLRASGPAAIDEVSRALASVKDPADQAAAAVALFGRGGLEMLPLLRSDMAGAAADAERLGLVFDSETASGADALGDSLDKLKLSSEAVGLQLAATFASMPETVTLVEGLAAGIGAIAKTISENRAPMQEFLRWLIDLKAESTGSSFARGLLGSQAAAVGLAVEGASWASFLGGSRPTPKTPTSLPSGTPSLTGTFAGIQAAGLREAEKQVAAYDAAVKKAHEDAVKWAREMPFVAAAIRDGWLKAASAPGPGGQLQGAVVGGPEQAEPTPLWMRSAEDQAAMAQALSRQSDIEFEALRRKGEADRFAQEINAASAASKDWAQELQNVDAAMRVLGVSADSTLGRMMGGLASAGAAWKSLNLKGKDGGFSLTGGKGFGGLLANLGPAMQMAGAAISIGKAIVGLFRSDPVAEAQKTAGAALGVGISRTLAETILKQSKALGISVQNAALLSITAAASESGKSLTTFAPQLSALMSAVSSGAVPAAAGVKQLGEAFSALEKEAAAGSLAASQTMVEMIRQSEATHVRVAEILEFVKKSAQTSATAIGAAFDAVTESSAGLTNSMTFMAGSTLAMFNKLRAQGLSLAEALDVVGKSVDAAVGAYARLGLELPSFLAELAAIRSLNQQNADLVAVIEGTTAGLRSLRETGAATSESFGQAQQAVSEQWDKLLGSGYSQSQALAMLAPSLLELRNMAAQYGFELDGATQALVAQAEAAGEFDKLTGPFADMATSLETTGQLMALLVESMGVKLPEAIKRANDEWLTLNSTAASTTLPGGLTEVESPTGYASGFYSASMGMGPLPGGATPLLVHPGETVSITPRVSNLLPFVPRSGVSVQVSPVINVNGAGHLDTRALAQDIALELERGTAPRLARQIREAAG